MSNEIKDILIDLLPGIDDDSIEYFHSMISNGEKLDLDNLKETMVRIICTHDIFSYLDLVTVFFFSLSKLGTIYRKFWVSS